MVGHNNVLNERDFWVFRGFGEVGEPYFFSIKKVCRTLKKTATSSSF